MKKKYLILMLLLFVITNVNAQLTLLCSVKPGSAVASATTSCSGSSVTLSLNGASTGTTITYQWQRANYTPSGLSVKPVFTDIPGATSDTYIIANLTAHGSYRCVVTCTLNGVSDSQISTQVNITMQDTNPPSVSNQTFCSSRNATLADLVITGTNIKWYDASTGGNVLLATTPLVNGTTYYASQTLNNCESTRSAVQVTITPTTSLTTTQLDFCSGVKIEDVELEGFSPADLRWYDDATTTTAIASSQDLQTGTYYVSTYSGNCESVRQPIQVDVAAPVASPTGSTHQKFLFAATIDDLVMNEQGVQWYADYDDALTQSNELSGTTSLVDGASYFGILVDTNDCGSEPIEVEVEIDLLNNSSFDLSKLVYYPNPVVSELTIEYKDKIRSVTIYNLLGQQVFNHKYDVTNISIDLSAFTAGTYIVKLETSTETQLIKVIKK